jgi:catechol 2,3-dioxygenase-like lactoylglutathione lyase family enzyme
MPTIRYLVHDVDEALPFYERLGFRLKERPGPPIALVERAGLTLWLAGPASSAARALPDGKKPSPGGWNRLVIEVDDLEAAMAPLRAAGAHFRSDPISGPGGRQVLVDDPSGNPIELFEARGR